MLYQSKHKAVGLQIQMWKRRKKKIPTCICIMTVFGCGLLLFFRFVWFLGLFFRSSGENKQMESSRVSHFMQNQIHLTTLFRHVRGSRAAIFCFFLYRDVRERNRDEQKTSVWKLKHHCLSCTFHRHMISSRTLPRRPQWPATWNSGMIDYQRKGERSGELCGFSDLVLTRGFECGRKAL